MITLHLGDCIESMRGMEAQSVQTCVTSPPYFGLRDYGHDGQIGLEPTPAEFVEKLVEVFREVRRVLRDDGTLWLNLGDSYASTSASGPQGKNGARASRTFTAEALGAGRHGLSEGLKSKDLIGIPWRVAFALQADGWYLRQEIIWHKPNPMPESVTDRCTKAHESIFLLAKSERYYFDHEAIKEPSSKFIAEGARERTEPNELGINGRGMQCAVAETRNRRNVWTVASRPYKGAHFATFPPALIEPCILAGAPSGGLVLDPFGGSGTTAQVALQHGRRAVLCELNPSYEPLIWARLTGGFA